MKYRYRVQFDGHYVCEKEWKYLVECKEEESDFSETNANRILEACPVRVKIFKIIPKPKESPLQKFDNRLKVESVISILKRTYGLKPMDDVSIQLCIKRLQVLLNEKP